MQKVRIGGVPEHFNYPWHYALDKGYFSEEEIDLDWKSYDTGTGAMCKDLREENLDLAVVLTEGGIADIIKGNPSKIIQVYVETPLLWGIHVPGDSDLNNESDIKGKVYGISRFGSGSHLMAFVDAKIRGWNTSDLSFKIVNNIEGARNAFKSKEAEVFFWEKFTTKPWVDQGEFKRVGIRPTPWPCFMLVGREKFIKENPGIVKSLSKIIIKATQEVQNSGLSGIEQIANFYKLDKNDVKEWFSITRWANNKQVDRNILEKVMDSLLELNIIESKVSADDLVSTV